MVGDCEYRTVESQQYVFHMPLSENTVGDSRARPYDHSTSVERQEAVYALRLAGGSARPP